MAAAISLFVFGAAPDARPSAPADRRPNILLIMADDMGYSDLGCYGGEIATPNLDRLAREGMSSAYFYNNAKCTPSRASLLTGMYPRGDGGSLPDSFPTIAEILRRHGYLTAMSGKWHLGSVAPKRPIDRGFDEYYGLLDGAVNYFNPAQRDPEFKGGQLRRFAHNNELIHEFPRGFYTTDAFAAHAIETIRQFSQSGRPFFHYLAFTAPHNPLQAWPGDIVKYRGKYRMGWDKLRRQRHERQLRVGLIDPDWKLPATDPGVYDWNSADQDWEDARMATYAAMIDRMDWNIGRVLAAIEELRLEQNTIVIFVSDNGGCAEEPGGRDPTQRPGLASTYTSVGPGWAWAQNTPFRRYKSWMQEGGIATPFIVRWPGRVKPGSRTTQIGHIIDLLPTCLDVVGAVYPAEWQGAKTIGPEGRSLLPIWKGAVRDPPARRLFWEWDGNCAVREGKWKIVWDRFGRDPHWELYDLEADGTESNDLSAREPVRVRAMAAAYQQWAGSADRASPGEVRNPARSSRVQSVDP